MKHTRPRPLPIVAVAVSLLLALGGCSGGSEDASSTENPYGLIEPGSIQVGSVGDIKPYTYTNADGEFTGFGVELFEEVAERIGIENVVFRGQDFSSLLAAVANGQFDVGVAAIGITDERKETVDFSDDYLAGYLTVLTTQDSGIKEGDDLAGERLGVVQGTLQETYARENYPEADLVRFPDNNTGVSALTTGTIAAHFLDFESAKAYVKQYDLVNAINVPSFDAPAGFAVSKDNPELKKALNEGLEKVMQDGTWKELHEQWFEGSPMPEQYLPDDQKD